MDYRRVMITSAINADVIMDTNTYQYYRSYYHHYSLNCLYGLSSQAFPTFVSPGSSLSQWLITGDWG